MSEMFEPSEVSKGTATCKVTIFVKKEAGKWNVRWSFGAMTEKLQEYRTDGAVPVAAHTRRLPDSYKTKEDAIAFAEVDIRKSFPDFRFDGTVVD